MAAPKSWWLSLNGTSNLRRKAWIADRQAFGGLAGIAGREHPVRRNNVALRLQTSLLEEAKRVAEAEGVALNQLINVAVAEKLSAIWTEDYFRTRAARADLREAKQSCAARRGQGQSSGSRR